MSNKTSFSIENEICPSTGEIYGKKYAGTFSVRRASIQDRINADLRNAAILSAVGDVNPNMIAGSTRLNSYIFAFVQTVAEQPLPEWFDMDTMFEDSDSDAVLTVWGKVGEFLDSFRSQNDSNPGEQGSGQPTVLVSE